MQGGSQQMRVDESMPSNFPISTRRAICLFLALSNWRKLSDVAFLCLNKYHKKQWVPLPAFYCTNDSPNARILS
jgi:hypothetical protein